MTERLRPDVMTRFGLNRLGSDPQLFAGLPHASFDNKTCAETLPYFPDIDVGTLEVEGRCPRNHVQPRYPRKRVRDLFTDPVAKVVLLWLRTHVHERQHGNAYASRSRCGSNFFAMLCRLGVKPSEDRNITAWPQSNQNRVNRTLPFLVIDLQLRSETASLDPNNRVDVRIVLRGAVEHLHRNREFFEAIDISIDCPIHDVRQKPA